MIKLITGTPGSGKTLFGVAFILEEAKKGRSIYSDIDGLNIQGVMPIPDNLDWRDTPEGSLVVYDEAQQNNIFKAGKGALSDNEIVKDLEVHRHTGHDIVFITQSPIFMHNHIRQLVGEHSHLHRPYGAAVASVYQWRVCENNPNTDSAKKRSENNRLFNFDKSLFDHYKSATVHTHKFKIPSKIRNMVLILFCLVGLAFFFFNQTKYFKKPAESAAESAIAQSSAPSALSSARPDSQSDYVSSTDHNTDRHELQRVAFVVSTSAGECYAKNSYGELLDIDQAKCKLYDDHPSLLSSSRSSQNQQNYDGWQSKPDTSASNVSYTNTVPTQQSQDTIM